MHYKSIIFDFDGTLVNSFHIKRDVYYEVFDLKKSEEFIIDEVLSKNPEMNRYETIKIIASRLEKDIDINKIIQDYNDIVLYRVKNAAPLEYAQELLNYLHKNSIPMYISSNTPVEVLKDIIEHKKWTHFFDAIYGFPANKNDTLKNIVNKNNYSNKEYIVIGDGDSDKKSAEENGTDFFHVKSLGLSDLINLLKINWKLLK